MPVARRLLVLALLLLSATPGYATVRGWPLLQRYTAEEIPAAPQHLAVTSDDQGVIYVGNVEGVLRFAGGRWERFELPGQSSARSLQKAWDGRIYVGGYDQFGVLASDDTGELRYEDLRPRFGLSGSDAHVGDVWSILETPRGLFFRSSGTMFFLGRDGATRQWPLPDTLRGVNVVGEAIYARVAGVGFTRFEDGRLVPMPGAEVFAERPLLTVVARRDALLLVSEDGFYEADAHGIRKLASDADAAFAANTPYSSHQLADGSLVFGTYDGVLMRFSPELALLDRVPLGANTLLAFGTDREGGLWVATEVDLVRLKLPSPWTAFGPGHGLVGSATDSAWYDGTLWVATSVDILRAQYRDGQTQFVPQHWTNLEAYDLEPTDEGLLVGEREGVMVLDRGAREPRRILRSEAAFALQRSDHDRNVVFALCESELLRLALRDGSWQLTARWPFDGMRVNAFYETAPGELWLGDLRGAPQRWRIDPASGDLLERRTFGPEAGLDPDSQRGSTLFRLDRRIYAVSGERGYMLDGERFVPSDLGPFKSIDRPMELSVVDTALGSYAWTSRQMLHRAPKDTVWKRQYLDSRMARGFVQVQDGSDGKLRVVTWNGVLQFDPAVPETPPPTLRTTLEHVDLRDASGTQRALALAPATAPELPPQPELHFLFGLVSMEPNAEFRYRLVGFKDQGWSEWNVNRDVTYRSSSLGPGEYQMEVQARTRSGRSAEPLRYPFRVQPMWHETPWAWAAAAVAALLLVAGLSQLIVRIRYRQYVAVNRKLEHKISERTAELETANRKLSELATEDGLTGVANRRALELALGREWQRCGELQVPLAVVMVDVDHFKQFNDRHGHLEGDQQLRRVAQALKQEVHPVRELVARFGGEEFALVLPGLHLEEAMARAERLRQRFLASDSALTVSLGVASIVPNPGLEPSELLRRADTALYRAKRKGRNRVEAAEE